MKTEIPATVEEASAVLARCSGDGLTVRFRGGGTKSGWGRPIAGPDVELSTASLTGILEHNAGDLTAIVLAGTPLSVAQAAFAEAGQMLALDPPDPAIPYAPAGDNARTARSGSEPAGDGAAGPRHKAAAAAGAATIGGVLATADSGPLRHRYGSMRDLALGVQVALADGTLARAGGKVIKNVAGYDLAKLFTGSFGTLGLITELAVRLYPIPARTATAVGRSPDPTLLAVACRTLAAAPLEADSLDIAWNLPPTSSPAAPSAAPSPRAPASAGPSPGAPSAGRRSASAGAVLVRFASADPGPRVAQAAEMLKVAGLEVEIVEDDEPLWAAQRAGQRTVAGALVKVSAPPAELAAVLAAARSLSASVVGRAALGISYLTLPDNRGTASGAAATGWSAPGEPSAVGERSGASAPAGAGAPPNDLVAEIAELRRRLPGRPSVVLDAPDSVREALDPWGGETGPVSLMRRIKAQFDPGGICAPGLFVGDL